MERDRSLDVAVTGMAGRVSGTANLEQFRAALLRGQTLLERLDPTELRAAGVSASLAEDPAYVPVLGRVADADRFDHEFFGVSPREAYLLDPQQRLMLECAWQALEDAGHRMRTPDPMRTAVFASASSSQHMLALLTRRDLDALEAEDIILANERDFLATRIAYKLGLTGPAVTVLTACSSSLVAVHLAIQALNNGECDQAVVIAASVNEPQVGHLHVPGSVMSGTGACRPFDAAADGTVGGGGVLAVVLRRYQDVEAGPVPMYGVLVGSAVNNDGSGKAGYTAPSLSGQERVIEEAVAAAGVPAATIGYLEAHGTGTSVGDPIEWSAASTAYARLGASAGQIRVGAAKSIIGHLDCAAGLAGLIAALLVVDGGVIPPLAALEQPNPLLEQEGSPLTLPIMSTPWPGSEPRRAAVSSFGIGGTNAHVLIEQPPEPPPASGTTGPGVGDEVIIALSAADPEALQRMRHGLADHLERARPDLATVARTLAGRTGLSSRYTTVGSTVSEIAHELRSRAARDTRADGAAPPLIFLFPGQGTQTPGMAQVFAETLPGFDAAVDRCLSEFGPKLAGEVRLALYDRSFPADRMAATAIAQPALFAVEYAAATALEGNGLSAAALAGHSIGELTAACFGGSIALGDAARLVEMRGRVMQECEPGSMLALACSVDEARNLIARTGARLEVAAVNSATDVVLSGPSPQIEFLVEALANDPIRRRVLRTSHAFHSAAMTPAADALRNHLALVPMNPARIPWSRNLDGSLVGPGQVVTASDFADQLRQPVQFAWGLDRIAASYHGAVAIEVGPGQALSAMAYAAGMEAVPLCPAAGRSETAPRRTLLAALGSLWSAGQQVDLVSLGGVGRHCRLPAYPFRGTRWLVPPPASHGASDPASRLASGPITRSDSTAAVTASREETSPEAEPTALVTQLWRELLGDIEIRPAADFFGLGGDSLAVTRLARRMEQVFGVPVPVRRLLDERTVKGHARVAEDLLIDQVIKETAGSEASL